MKVLKKLKKIGKNFRNAIKKAARSAIAKMSRPFSSDETGRKGGRSFQFDGNREQAQGSRSPFAPTEVRLDDLTYYEGVSDDDDSRSPHVVTNHLDFRWVGSDGPFSVYQYHVVFQPSDCPPYIRRTLVHNSKELFHGEFTYDGDAQLFSLQQFTKGKLRVVEPRKPEAPSQRTKYSFEATYVRSVPYSDPIYKQMLNLIVKKCMFGLGLEQIGQNFYDPRAKTAIPDLKLEIWPGFQTATKICNRGTLLCIDVTNKVVQTKTVLDLINLLKVEYDKKRSPLPFDEFLLPHLKGTTVITPYNQKTYSVEGILMESAAKYTFEKENGERVSLLEYYRNRYQIVIEDVDQPLIVTKGRRAKVQDDKRVRPPVILLPELCGILGLSDEMRGNMGIMKRLATYLHPTPRQRLEIIKKIGRDINNSEKCGNILRDWGFTVDEKLTGCTEGRLLPKENIRFRNSRFRADEKGDFTKALRNNQMLVAVPLKKWVVVCGVRDSNNAKEFVRTMQRVSGPLGFQISDPAEMHIIQDVRIGTYVRTLETVALNWRENGLQLAFCVLPGFTPANNLETYSAIKKRFSVELGVPSQCVLSKNLASKNAMSIATKIVVQMNTKVGGEPWSVDIPKRLKQRTLALGFEFYGKTKKYGAVVGSMNDEHTKYYSVVFQYRDGLELIDKLNDAATRVVAAYQKLNDGNLPNTVIFYRSNMDEGQVSCGHAKEDADSMQEYLKDTYSRDGNEPFGFIYIALGRRNATRLMAHTGSCEGGINDASVVNSFPGTVVDTDIVETRYPEFFLVPTVARQGTARVVHYRILLDTIEMPLDVLESYTFKMCHLYYNWTGTVNIPSVCQYAGKLASQTAQNLGNNPPHPLLSERLHYL